MAQSSSSRPPLGPDTYAAFHAGCLQALDDEIAAVRRELASWGGDQPSRVLSATTEGVEGDSYLYAVRLPTAIRAPEFTAVDVVIKNTIVRGFVEEVGEEGRLLLLALEEPVQGNWYEAELRFDPTAILANLRGGFADLAPDRAAADRLAPVLRATGYAATEAHVSPASHPSLEARGFNAGQRDAIARTTESDVGLILGPPGTGKTRTLGSLVAELAESRNRRILVTAHTNGALDTAMASVLDALPAAWGADGRIVRLGKLSRNFRHLGIGQQDVADRLGAKQEASPELLAKVTELEAAVDAVVPATPSPAAEPPHSFLTGLGFGRLAQRKETKPRNVGARLANLLGRLLRAEATLDPEVATALRDRIRTVQRARRDEAASVARRARIVGATLSKLAMDPEEAGEFDTVIVDEASMAMLPQVALAASRGKQQLVVLGDPIQLAPVVKANTPATKTYLKRDLFRHLGLEAPTADDPRRPMLTMQYRMVPAIRALISETFYDGLLEDAPEITAAAAAQTGTPEPTLILLDTSEAGAESTKKGKSWVNPVHAAIAVEAVRQLHDAQAEDIGVITPFAAQRQFLRQVLSKHAPSFFRRGGFLGTIHQAQGGERDTIIIDLVDALPQTSSFLDERWNEEVPRLLNVALSRARHRLVLIAHARALRGRYGKRGALIMRILERAYREGMYVPVGPDGLDSGVFAPLPVVEQPDLGLDPAAARATRRA